MRRNDAIRTVVVASGLALLAGLAVVSSAQGQYGSRPTLGIGVRFGIGLVGNLILGALALAVGGRKTDEIVSDAKRRPVAAIATGLGFAILLVVVVFVLAITGIGLILAIPIALAAIPIGLAGSAITTLVVGTALGSTLGADSAWAGLVIGALTLAVVNAIPVVGFLFSLTVGTIGTGILVLRFWKGTPENRTGQSSFSSEPSDF